MSTFDKLAEGCQVPFGFQLDSSGIFYETPEGTQQVSKSPVVYFADERDFDKENWKACIRFLDLDDNLRELYIDKSQLHDQSIIKILMNNGCHLVFGAHKLFLIYLDGFTPHERRLRANRTGWHGPIFVLPNRIIPRHALKEKIVFNSTNDSTLAKAMIFHGNFYRWRKEVASKVLGNPIMMFALCASFAPPLLKPLGHESFGFHIHGKSSHGKTTTLQVAASTWGNGSSPSSNSGCSFIKTWSTTANAVEGIASSYNDICLPMDEIGQCDAVNFEKVIYDLFSGRGKTRMNKDATIKSSSSWQTVVLSSGESSAREKMLETSKLIKAGVAVRMIDIPTYSGIIHDSKGLDSATFAEDLKASCSEHFGWAGPLFVSRLEKWHRSDTEAIDTINEYIRYHTSAIIGSRDLEPEQVRAIKRFALVGAAGDLAISAKILPWNEEDVARAVKYVANLWLKENPYISDGVQALKRIRDYIQANQSRFVPIDREFSGRDTAGYIVRTRHLLDIFLFHEKSFTEASGGVSPKVVCAELKKRHLLHQNNSGKNKCRFTVVNSDAKAAFYGIYSSILEYKFSDDEDGPY